MSSEVEQANGKVESFSRAFLQETFDIQNSKTRSDQIPFMVGSETFPSASFIQRQQLCPQLDTKAAESGGGEGGGSEAKRKLNIYV